ncbi:M15 family peptidase [Deinococcus sp. Arct2-2]|uniref:M15 family metallopeptidase n=1 Tax=Deinococcus sp. Arct2-2 TaxID=2568653 RepID=UPI0010A4AFEF|nr:M15 family metallopeptidase [Deinococcus sp. Arct2-2]THF68488.1 M15 family peptidase [Deinococcus sp. Arct2-2]
MVLAFTTASSAPSLSLAPSDQALAQRLISAYPAFDFRIQGNSLVWKDGTAMPLQRVAAPSYMALLNKPGLLDQLDTPYPTCQPLGTPQRNIDPGRIRLEPLFLKMYGGSAAEVRRDLEAVNWFGQTLQVTRINGAAQSLRAIAAELSRQPELRKYLTPSAGTFLWRKVAGTPRLSVHSYGAAIDLNTVFSDYWLWRGYKEGQAGIVYRNRLPLAIVTAFEKHGWAWGGRWYHFDTMHFEYRPELVLGCGGQR